MGMLLHRHYLQNLADAKTKEEAKPVIVTTPASPQEEAKVPETKPEDKKKKVSTSKEE